MAMDLYRIWCVTEAAYVKEWAASKPAVCPNDGGHTIDANKTAIITCANFCVADEIEVGTGLCTHDHVVLGASEFMAKGAAGAAGGKTAAESRAILQSTSYASFYIGAEDFVTRTTNGAQAATEETDTNDRMIPQFLFDPDTEEGVQRKFKMPDDWDLGTFKVKVDWDGSAGASAGDVVLWGIRGVAIGDNEDLDGAWGTEVEVSDVLLQNDGGKGQTTAATGAITIGGTPALGKMIWLQLARKAEDGTDTMDAEDAKGLGIDVQYGVLATTPGSW